MKNHGSMNRIFRLVWSDVLNGWIAVAERTRGRGKGSSRKLIAAMVASLGCVPGSGVWAAPVGSQVTAGAGSVVQSGATTNITQASQNLAINWKSFNIAAQETVNFIQPTAASIAVNRIADTNGTQILGHLNANGQVYLINPNGVLFGKGAQVNIGGLVASTLDLNDVSSSGASKSFSGTGTGSVVNQGVITAANYVALLGNQVSNQGVITAQMGTVALGAGSAATLSFSANRLVNMHVDRSVLNSLAENSGLIQADGGQVFMTAGARDSLLASTVNNTGIISARTVEEHDGVIMLVAGMTAGSVHVDGTLDASAPVRGNGGFIETSAAQVKVADTAKITTAAAAGATGTWLIDPTDYTIAATGGDISGALVSAFLSGNNVRIMAASGSKSGVGNINVNDVVSWNANTLTLVATSNIYINSALNGGTAGKLDLQYGQGGSAESNYFVRAPVSLAAGNNFSTKLGANPAVNYVVITSLGTRNDAFADGTATTLQGMAGPSSANLSGHYALGADINAAPTKGGLGYTAAGEGFIPIGSSSRPFAGAFDGLGHTINDLDINRPNESSVGLFGSTSSLSSIRNVSLYNASVIGAMSVGALVGGNSGKVFNSSSISSYVSGTNSVGALVGGNSGVIANNYAIKGSGGLVEGYIVDSVNGFNNSLGGLVGSNAGTIVESFSSVPVAGYNGYDSIGGLVGSNTYGKIIDSYATGQVSGSNYVGGLVGTIHGGVIFRSYASGKVIGDSERSIVGGLLGRYNGGAIDSNFWDIASTGQSISGSGVGGETGLSLAQMQKKVNFTTATSANGNVNPGWIFQTVAPAAVNPGPWFNYDDHTYPLLTFFMTPLTVSMKVNASAIYNGHTYADAAGVAYSLAPTNSANLPGNLSFSYANNGVATSVVNAGTYTVTPAGLYSNQMGYIINYASGPLVINKAPLTASLPPMNKVYDGNTSAVSAANITSGLVPGESVSALAIGNFNSKDVLTASRFTVDMNFLFDGTGKASNYSLAGGQFVDAKITARPLSATASAPNKTYDGSNTAAPTLVIASAGFVTGEAVTATATGTFNSKDVVTATRVTVASTTLVDGTGKASNYSLASGQSANAKITAKSLSVTASAPDKTYDGSTTAAPILTIASDSLVTGETVTATGTGVFNSKDVLDARQVTVNSSTLVDGAGGKASNYSLGSVVALNVKITAKVLTATGSAPNKTYDGNTTAAPILMIASTGLVTGESVTATATGSFNTKDVLTANRVTVNTTTLVDGSGKASNYSLDANGYTAAAQITAKALTATASAPNKTYDGNTTAAPILTIASAGLVNGETVTATATGTFNSKDVLSANLVTVNSTTLTNGMNAGQASNYSLVSGQTADARITAKALTATANAPNKTYDGNTTAAPILTIASAGLVNGETVTATATGTFNSKDVLSANLVTVNSTTLTNGRNAGQASNYSLVSGETASANITAKALTATASASNKTYDGNTTAAPLLMIVSAGFVTGETVTATATGTFNSKDVLTANLVTVNSTTLADGVGGGQASNYSLASGQTAYAGITAKALTATASAPNKTYDGNTTAAPLLTIVSAGFVTGETVTATATGTFNSKDVLTANLVTVNSTTLADGVGGGQASNYSLVSGETASANITAKALTATASAPNKTYDGNTTAAPILTIVSAGFVTGETVTATATGTFNSKDVLTANLVTVNSTTLADGVGGGQASNYSLVSGETASANITAKALTATASAPNKTYDGNTTAAPILTIASAGLVSEETVTATATGTFDSKDVLTANLVTVNSTTLVNGSGKASNYSLATGQTANAKITAKALTATASAPNKTYDGNTTAAPILAINSAGLVTGETVTATATGTFNSKDVLTANLVTVASAALVDGSGKASNYSLGNAQTANAKITAKALTATASAPNKTYDGSTTAAPSLAINSAGLVTGETVTATGTGTFNSKDVLTANLVTVNTTTLVDGSGKASNYSLANGQTAKANITAKALTATASAPNKTYDGNTTAAPILKIASAGLVNDETVTATATGTFNSKDVLTANLVTVASAALVDGSGKASNYSLGNGQTANAKITAKALTATASAPDKTYDGNTTAAPSLAIASAGFVNDETVTASATGTFNSKDVLTANLVTVNTTTLVDGSGKASNYSLATGETANANITAKALSASIGTISKTYDGTTTAIPIFNIDPRGFVGSETVVATGSASFNSKDVTTAQQITVTGSRLLDGENGGLASNYSLPGGQSAAATITAKPLAASLTTASKVYDGSTRVTPTLTITSGLVGIETVTASGTASLNSKDVDTAKFATLNSTALLDGANGGRATNYSLAPGQTALAKLTQAPLLYTATAATSPVGQVPSDLSGSVSGLVNGDTLAGSTTGSLTWMTTATPASSVGVYPINGGGLTSVNYSPINAISNATALALQAVNIPSALPNVDALSRSTKLVEVKPGGNEIPDIALIDIDKLPATAAGPGKSAATERDMVDTTTINTRISLTKMGPTLTINKELNSKAATEKNLLDVNE